MQELNCGSQREADVHFSAVAHLTVCELSQKVWKLVSHTA